MADLRQPIAIVGMAGIFPKAPDVATFWSNILNLVDAVDDPLPEWGGEHFLGLGSQELGRIYTQKGGFLKELSRFDPRGYGIMPVAVSGSEPDQFHALDCARRALEDAGLRDYRPESIGIILGHGIHANRANVNGIQMALVVDQTVRIVQGLFPGASPAALAEVRARLKARLPAVEVDATPGLVPNVMTGRICNRLDLMGPNYIIDAACASSLIAVEAAMLELQRGRADVMLTGGVNTSTSPLVYAVFCALGALSRSSSIRPFDARADGTLLGEGAGVLVLKRLADAVRAGDRIYAVLRAGGQSSDGRDKGVMAPRLEGEVLAMERAYRQGGIDPASIGLVEAHGTGIPLGDRTEVAALGRVWGERRRRLPHIALGSVKSQIGHCIPAAGIASLIKVALALYHRVLPPTLCGQVSDQLGLERTPFYLNTEARPWIHGGRAPRRAGVNAFGFGGVNSHIILEEPPGAEDPLGCFLPTPRPGRLFRLAGTDREALLQEMNRLRARLPDQPWVVLPEALGGEGRWRLAIVAADGADLARKLDLAARKLGESGRHRIQARNGVYFCDQPVGGRVAFLFPGENSQYPGMLAALAMQLPVVRAWFDFLDELFEAEREVAPSEAIFPPPTGLSDLDRTWLQDQLAGMELGSESAFVADQAMFHLLGTLGVQADAMLGHSTGENAALVASGIPRLGRAEIGRQIRQMNRIYRELEANGAIPEGVLLSVGATTLAAVQGVLARAPEVTLALDNCTNQFILFGPPAAIAQVGQALKSEGAVCLPLALSRGYHTAALRPMAEAFRALFEGVEIADSGTQLYSCATAAPFPLERDPLLDTVASQYMSPVRFREAVERLYADGARVFVEIGPSSNLTAFVRDILGDRPHLAVASNHRSADDWDSLQHLLGRLFVEGVPVDPGRLPAPPVDTAPGPPGPYLSTSLPFIDLCEEDLARLRVLLAPPGPPPAAAGPVRVGEAASPPPARAASPVDRAQAIERHLELMQAFLAQQARLMDAWQKTRGNR
jgi:acyl transferase domain-containing protein